MTKKENKLSQYVDTSGTLSSGQLKFSEWYLRNKFLLEKIGKILMIIIASVTMGTSLFLWGKYLFFGYWEDEKMMLRQVSEFTNYNNIKVFYAANDLEISSPKVFRSANNAYDLTAEVGNPNKRWIAYVSYYFVTSGGETDIQKAFILPGEKIPITVFGYKSLSLPTGTKLVIENVKWDSIDPHHIFDVAGYMESRRAFAIDNFFYEKPREGGVGVSRITFDFYNNSAYGYWLPVFYLELLNNNKTVGYVYFVIEDLGIGEKREMDLRYFGDGLTVTNYRLIPIINVFDDDVYISPDAEQ
jgi:hypothetical protein